MSGVVIFDFKGLESLIFIEISETLGLIIYVEFYIFYLTTSFYN